VDVGAEIQEGHHPIRLQKLPNSRLTWRPPMDDFTENFEHGLAKLRKFLREMDSPRCLQALQDRLADDQRALRRAKGDEEKRIQADIGELKSRSKYSKKSSITPGPPRNRPRRILKPGWNASASRRNPSQRKFPPSSSILPRALLPIISRIALSKQNKSYTFCKTTPNA
jgi:hypothetical protein